MERTSGFRELGIWILIFAILLMEGCHSKQENAPAPAKPEVPIQRPATPVPQAVKDHFARLRPIPVALQPTISFHDRIPANPADIDVEPEQSSTPPAGMFDPAAHPDATVLTALDVSKLSESEREFGVAPQRTKNVEYVDDIILMEEGDKAIRSLSSDGLSWTFDANAPHVNEFSLGKIVFATGRAVGRILAMQRDGDSVTVLLGPVQLTDVIKKGHFAMSQPVDVANMLTYVAPDYPQPKEELTGPKQTGSLKKNTGHFERAVVISRFEHGRWNPVSMAQTYPDGRRITYSKYRGKWSEGHVSLVNVRPGYIATAADLARMRVAPPAFVPHGRALPVPAQAVGGVAAGQHPPVNLDGDDVTTKAVASNSGIGLQFYYNKNGITLFSQALLRVINAKVSFELDITERGIETAGVQLDGELGIDMQAEAASQQNFNANLKKYIYEPIDFSIPLGLNGAAGVPFSITFGSQMWLATGFSAKTSKLSAKGLYTFGGGIWAGKKNNHWSVSTTPNPKAVTDIGQTIDGISMGINSLVVAAAIRMMVGIGAFGFNTGVFADILFNGTLLRGSDATTFGCRQGTVGAYLQFGIGYSLAKVFVEAINAVLALFTSYRLSAQGTIISSKMTRLFHGDTQIPSKCATPNGSGSQG